MKATLINDTGQKKVVEANTPQAQEAFGQGYKLMTKDNSLKGTLPTLPAAQAAQGDLGNLKIALRTALNEAGKARVARNYEQVAGAAGGVPGTIGSVVNMIRGGVTAPVESTFETVMSTFEKANEAKQKAQENLREAAFQPDVLASGKMPSALAKAFPELVQVWQSASKIAVENRGLDVQEQKAKIAAADRSNRGGGGSAKVPDIRKTPGFQILSEQLGGDQFVFAAQQGYVRSAKGDGGYDFFFHPTEEHPGSYLSSPVNPQGFPITKEEFVLGTGIPLSEVLKKSAYQGDVDITKLTKTKEENDDPFGIKALIQQSVNPTQ